MPGDLLIVASHHFQGDAQIGKGSQRLTRARLRRIEEGQKAGQGQVFLVGDVRMVAVRSIFRHATPKTRKPSSPRPLNVASAVLRAAASSGRGGAACCS